MKRKLMLLLACLFMGIGLVTAQNQTVTGVVISDEDGQPVIGASVRVEGTQLGSITDVDGKFTITNVPSSATTLLVTYVGMQEARVDIKPNVRVVLKSDTEMLDEVMVVAYGTAKKSAFTGSASTIKSDKIASVQTSNVTDALAGQAAGVQVTKTSGQPGSGSTVRIRGIGSFSASNTPLYVVDGIPYDGDIAAINTQDIESMTVLKDAAANALYGARGANGVIIITTKKGASGEARVSVDAKWGTNRRAVPQYEMIKNPNTYMETLYTSLYNAAYDSNLKTMSPADAATAAWKSANSNIFTGTGGVGYQMYTIPEGQYFIGRNGRVNPNAVLGYSDGEYYYTPDNWADELLDDSNLRQEYNLNISGGKDGLTYYASLGYLDDSGIVPGSNFTRYSGRMKTDYQAKKWLKVGMNASFTHYDSGNPGDQEGLSSGNIFYVADMIAPVYPLYMRDTDGNIMRDSYGRIRYDYGDSKTSTNFDREFMAQSNPGSALELDKTHYSANIFNGQFYGEVEVLEGLKARASFSYFVDDTRTNQLVNPFYGQYAELGGIAFVAHSRTTAINTQYLVTYKKTFKDVHNMDLMGGYEFYKLTQASLSGQKYGLYNPFVAEIDNAILNPAASSASAAYATLGYFFRAQYDYDGKYFASASYRRDASSRFHKDNRWGNFWSVGASWVMNKEGFLEDAEWIDLLKVKASYGVQGNDNIGNSYAYVDQYSLSNDNDNQALVLGYKANKDLTWESSHSFNAGVDFEFFGQRLNGTIEYFNRQTDDMLYFKPVPPSLGYSSIPMNIGSVRNNGVEVDLNGTIIETRDFTWTANANATFLKNKILKLHPDLEGRWINGSYIYREGGPMYNFYIRKYAGVDEEGNATWYKDVKDANGVVTGVETTTDWSEATQYELNKTVMPKMYGGFGSTFKYKGIDLGVIFSYQVGGHMYDNRYAYLMHNGTSGTGQNWHRDILNAWTPDNTNTDVPRLSYDSNSSMGTSVSDRFIISSNYLSLQNITLGYTLPKQWTRKLMLESVRIYGVADNLALWSKRKGLDPRMGLQTTSDYTYSLVRSISGGISVTF